ncbi:MAG: DUF1203 domain-containing protein [Paracoccaceae bacterium]
MSFQIEACDAAQFASFFAMSDEALAAHQIHRMTVTAKPGTPCRVSLADAEVGETVLLLNYTHQPAPTPFRASHAIYVREGVAQAHPAVGAVPEVLASRLISVRLFDAGDMMVDADVVAGTGVAAALERAFADPAVAYAHLHYAKQGCFAARARRG